MDRAVDDETPLVISMGEPAGIGPEVILKTWLMREVEKLQPFYVVGDPHHLAALSEKLNLDVPVSSCLPSNAIDQFKKALPVFPLDGRVLAQAGKLNQQDGALVTSSIITAVEHVFNGDAAALVTAPINKKALYDSGFEYPGHTEFLAALAKRQTGKSTTPVMMITGPELRTIPVTIHIPIQNVPSVLTQDLIYRVSKIAAEDLRSKFGISSPRLAISGLNPHAGENGAMGKEDDAIIKPAVEQLKADGINARGPLPADTMFHKGARSSYDVAVCMYHDQALIPAKTLGFDDAVNVTLGLPFIRTSPDHGTALDIAGKGIANPASMIAAVKMAGNMAAAMLYSMQTT